MKPISLQKLRTKTIDEYKNPTLSSIRQVHRLKYMDLDEKYFINNKGQREFAGVLKGFDDFFNMVL